MLDLSPLDLRSYSACHMAKIISELRAVESVGEWHWSGLVELPVLACSVSL